MRIRGKNIIKNTMTRTAIIAKAIKTFFLVDIGGEEGYSCILLAGINVFEVSGGCMAI